MTTTTIEETVATLEIRRDLTIDAPIEITFESILEEIGPECEMPDGTPFPMHLEAWPGGRWYRDLGDNKGHLWGHVQVIKPPELLELSGPLFMSYPAVNFLQYRLSAEGKSTRLQFVHRAVGLLTADHREGVKQGWEHWLKRIAQAAAQRKNRHNGNR